MSTATITLQIPENIYERLVQTASATKRPLEEIIIQVLKVGSPPTLDDIPDNFKAELADLDQLNDESLWKIATNKKTSADLQILELLISKSKEDNLTEIEQLQLNQLHHEFDTFMLRKAQSAALLRWRGYQVPNH